MITTKENKTTTTTKKQSLIDFWQALFQQRPHFQNPKMEQELESWPHYIQRIHIAGPDAIDLHIRASDGIDGNILTSIERELPNKLGIRSSKLYIQFEEECLEEKNFLCKLLPWTAEALIHKDFSLFSVFLSQMVCESNLEQISIRVPSNQKRLFDQDSKNLIIDFFKERVFIDCRLDIKAKEDSANEEDFWRSRELNFQDLIQSAPVEESIAPREFREVSESGEPKFVGKKKTRESSNNKEKNYRQKQPDNLIWGRMDNRLELTSMKELDSESGRVSVYGCVANYESRLVSNNTRSLVKFAIHGKEGAISCFLFLSNPDDEMDLHEKLHDGVYIRADLDVSYDAIFNKDLQGKVVGIMSAEAPEQRKDLALTKRVELHIHTNMSAKDGLSKPSELVKMADRFGMPAVAITDHGIVQAFPEAQDTLDKLRAKGSQLKLIYGSEVYLMDDGQEVVYGFRDLECADDFVAIDLETTGLDPSKDRIIEIGAVRFQKDETGHYFPEHRYSCFVNPGIPVPKKVTEITGITTEMIQDGKEPWEAIKGLKDFLGDSPMVAHNAFFDLSFLRYEGYRTDDINDPKMKFNPVLVDTLAMSRVFHPELERHNLKSVANFLQVNLENHHRAVDDAVACGFIFDKLWAEQDYLPFRELNERAGQDSLERIKDYKNKPYHLILLVKDLLGLYNLYRLISESHIRYFKSRPRIPRSLLRYLKDGLILGSACEAGEVFRGITSAYKESKGDYKQAQAMLLADKDYLTKVRFYDYLEIQPLANNQFMLEKEGNYIESQKDLIQLNQLVIDVANHCKRDVVATCDAHFLEEDDVIYRRILQVSSGFDAQENPTNLFFRTTDEMLEEFSWLPEDLRQKYVIDNTRKIADMVDPNVRPFPKGTFPPNIASAADQVEEITWDTCRRLYEKDGVIPSAIKERVEKELRSIIDNGFGIMYYISHMLVKKTNEDGYIVGSRGSVGSSVVAFLCGISEVNPLPPHYVCQSCHYSEFAEKGAYGSGFDMEDKNCPECGNKLHKEGQDIPFETFLGFNGDKQPDIDLNFSGEYQANAHQYIVEMFGETHTYRAGTITGYAEKNALGLVLKFAEEANVFLTKAESERLASNLIGIKKSTGQHPGGIVVIPKEREVFDFTPIQNPADKDTAAMNTTHFDFNAMHDTILKLDILGHDDPTMLKVMSDLTGVKIEDIPIPDERVMQVFQSTEPLGIPAGSSPADCGSLGLPEMGTRMARDMIKETQPTKFFDLVQLMGLSHGTDVWAGNAQDLIRSGTCSINEVIGCRDGIMTNLITWGLPSKQAFDIMEKVRKGRGLTEEQEQLMIDNKVPEWYIESCKKIKYMFPKAHAAAYVISSLRVAYFKVYHPAAYYAAYFSVRADEFDYAIMCQPHAKVTQLREELQKNFHSITDREQKIYYILELVEEMYLRGLHFAPIDIETADHRRFKIIDDKHIMPALNTLPSISTSMAENIVQARNTEDGPFKSHEDLMRRASLGQSAIANLVENKVLDHIPESAQLSLFDMM